MTSHAEQIGVMEYDLKTFISECISATVDGSIDAPLSIGASGTQPRAERSVSFGAFTGCRKSGNNLLCGRAIGADRQRC